MNKKKLVGFLPISDHAIVLMFNWIQQFIMDFYYKDLILFLDDDIIQKYKFT